MSDLRHGIGAEDDYGGRSKSGAGRHDTPVLDSAGVEYSYSGADGIGDAAGPTTSALAHSESRGMAAICLRDAHRSLGRLAAVSARVGFDRQSQSKHVRVDWHRGGYGLSV